MPINVITKLVIFFFWKKKKEHKVSTRPTRQKGGEEIKISGSDKELNKSTSGTSTSLCLLVYPPTVVVLTLYFTE
jgi:hypothetical protein